MDFGGVTRDQHDRDHTTAETFAVALALSLMRITAGRLDELQSWTNFDDVAKRFNSYADPALSFELHLLTFERG